MKIAKKLVAVAVSTLMMFSMAGMNVFAASTTQDGLEVSLTTDKETYSKDEKITATLSVKNTNESDVTDITMETIIPDGYEVADGTKNNKQFDKLAPNESVELKVVYVAKDSGEDSKDSEDSIVDPSNDSPKTGDNAILPVAIAVVLLVSVSLAVLCFKSKKGRKLLSVILTVSIVGGTSALITVNTNATDYDFISISTSIKLNDSNTILSAKVYYELSDTENEDYGEIYYSPVDVNHIFVENELVKYSDNEVLIVVKDGVTNNQVIDLVEKYDLSIVGEIEITGDYQLKSNKDISIDGLNDLISQIKNEEIIENVSLNYVQTYSDNQVEERNGFYYGKKWQGDLQNFNDDKGKSWGLEAIETLAAWDLLARNPNDVHPVKIGVIDSGFDSSHEDLSYVELFYENGQNGAYSSSKDHGTHVTGTIAARNDTDVGICGVYPYGQNNVYAVAMGGNNKLGNGINTFNENGTFWNSVMGQKIAFAELIVRNVKVINQSQGFNWYTADKFKKKTFGFESIDYNKVRDLFTPSNFTRMEMQSDILGDFLNRCLKKGYDFVIVSAAGNDSDSSIGHLESRYSNWNNLINPAEYPDVYNRIIVVGAVNNKFEIANYSNAGDRVDIFAPGTDIYSTTENSKYGKKSGTSMAAPHVSGVAAMVWSANNNLTGAQVKETVCRRGNLRCSSCKMVDAYMAVEHAVDLRDNNVLEQPNSTNGTIMSFVVQKNSEDIMITNAHIVVTNTKTHESFTAVTDNKGHFEIIVPKGKYYISVSADNYRDYNSESIITVNGNDVVYTDWIKLTRLSYVYGTVTNKNDVPIDDVEVTLTDNEGNTYGSKFTENGQYSFEVDFKNGRTYTATFEKTGYQTISITETDGGTNIQINAELKKSSDIEYSIPEDVLKYNGHSYYIYSDVANTWEEAKEYCESLGGYLAVINDEAENTALYNYMTSCGYQSAYFGYSDSETEGVWKWVSNDTSNYTNWASGEPNQERTTEDYAMFYLKYTDGKWNDGDFNGRTVQDTSAFICEWNEENENDWNDYVSLLNEFVSSGKWAKLSETEIKDTNSVFSDEIISYNDISNPEDWSINEESKHIFDMDGDGIPEMLLSIEHNEWRGPSGAATNTELVTIKDGKAKIIMNAYWTGGSMRGDSISVCKNSTDSRYYVAYNSHMRIDEGNHRVSTTYYNYSGGDVSEVHNIRKNQSYNWSSGNSVPDITYSIDGNEASETEYDKISNSFYTITYEDFPNYVTE